MKKLMLALLILTVFSIPAYAQMGSGMMGEQKGEMKPPCMMMGEGQYMSMMQMCTPVMQMMMDMMNMQEKIMKGANASEKKRMMKDMAQMKEKMKNMMSMNMGMMMRTSDAQSRLKCAEQWLKKAIDLHEVHIKDPKTASEASQVEMMDQMKKAYGCITGTIAETSGEPVKEPGSKEPGKTAPPKTDPHKH